VNTNEKKNKINLQISIYSCSDASHAWTLTRF